MLLSAMCFPSLESFALPEHSQTVAGSVSVEQVDDQTLNINQHSTRAIAEWSSFDIGSDESVNIYQPSHDSFLLNRILGGDPTEILGQLNANGQVWLMNGAGVMFGENAEVNVGGLLVTTANIGNENFMNGDYRFDQAGLPDAAIINRGTITAEDGPVGFFASRVNNEGTIRAKLNTVSLGATETYAIDFYGDGLLQVSLDPLDTDADVRSTQYKAENSGVIEAQAGTVEMSVAQGNAVIERMIEQTGAISVDSVGYDAAGNVVLGGGDKARTKVSGTIDANSYGEQQSGGDIEVQGAIIEVAGTARISANGSGISALPPVPEAKPETRGENGGGTIRIGGEYKGSGDMPTATMTFVDYGATISANAAGYGDGGEVIVWAEQNTLFGGHIDARGGEDGGNGGFVEVSGKQYLDFQGTTDRRAPNGKAGTLLLDPRNITISNGVNMGFPALTSPFDPNANNAILNVATLVGELGTGDVIVTTGADGVQAGDISVTAAITAPANGNSLSLLAANDVTISQDIDMSAGTGSLTITADSDNSGAGTYTQNGGSDLTTNNAQITITAADITLNGSIDSGTAATNLRVSNGGTIDVGAGGGGNLNLTNVEIDNVTAGSIVIGDATAGAITVSSDITPANTNTLHLHTGSTITATAGGIIAANLALTAGGLVDFTDVSTDVDNLAVSAAGQTVNFTDADDVDIDTVSGVVGVTAGTFALTAGGAVTDAQAIVTSNLAITATGAVTLDTVANDVDNLAVSAAGQTVNFTDTDNININTVSGVADIVADTVNLIAGGAIAGGLTVNNLTVTTPSAILTGTVMGGAGQGAANMITIGGVEGAGPYTLNGFCFASNCPVIEEDEQELAIETAVQNDQETETVLEEVQEDAGASDDLGYFEEAGSYDDSGQSGEDSQPSFTATSDDAPSSSSSNQGMKINGQYVKFDDDNPCPGVKLKAGDTIESGKGGGCLSTSEGSKLKMENGTKVNVQKVFYSPDGKEGTFFDIPEGSASFISKPEEHNGEIRTSVPGVTIRVTGTCYIVDHDKDNNRTTMILFGGGMELYIKNQLLKLQSPIEMVVFGGGADEKIKPVAITMDDVRERFGESVIPTPEELRSCGVKDEDMQ